MRAFIAVEPPSAFAHEVADMARQLSAHMDGRFAARSSYHVTLAFLGEIGEAEARSAMAALDAVTSGVAPVALRPTGLGKFGRASGATLWLGLDGEHGLNALAERVREELADRGVAYDDSKTFLAHLTLARRTRIPRADLPALPFPNEATATRVTLFKSLLEPDGAVYKPLHTVELES